MSYVWIPSSTHGGLPPNAVYGGNDVDGSAIYVGRAYHEGNQLPVKVIPGKQYASFSHDGREHVVHNFEVLTGNGFTWVGSGNGHVPDGAVMVGNQSNGEPLYVGRGHCEGSLTVGKVHPSHGCLYLPFGMAERSLTNYEVLIGVQKANWISTSAYQPIPPGSIIAGNDVDGSLLYVGRAYHEGDLLPAKVIPGKNVAYVAWGGEEIAKHQYDMLCNGNTSWIPSSYGSIPPNAIPGGHTSNGETLYVGRTNYNGSLTPGKVHPSHQTLYISFDGSEVGVKNYEVLVEN